MLQPYVGQVMAFAGNFPPKGWAFCDGAILSIAQNTALFSLLGTTYGGNGTTTFALPDLRGRAASNAGQGNGLTKVDLGEDYGIPAVSLLTTNIPPHIHGCSQATAGIGANSSNDEESDTPIGSYLRATTGINTYATTATGKEGPSNASLTIGVMGGSQPFNNIQPSLGLNYCIALVGLFPSRP